MLLTWCCRNKANEVYPGGIWNCIVGSDFKCSFHSSSDSAFVTLGKINVLLYRC